MGVERCRSTVHNWVQKADLQPTDGVDPNHVAVDETVIQLNAERYWLYAAVDPNTNRLLHVRLYPTRTQALTEMFLSELREKHLVDNAVFFVDGSP
jgi:transposase-like protein